jgi:hypothetical protein
MGVNGRPVRRLADLTAALEASGVGRAAASSLAATMPMPGLGVRPVRIRFGTTRLTTSTDPDRRGDQPGQFRRAAARFRRTPDRRQHGDFLALGRLGSRRCRALTTPVVRVWSRPNGLPIA